MRTTGAQRSQGTSATDAIRTAASRRATGSASGLAVGRVRERERGEGEQRGSGERGGAAHAGGGGPAAGAPPRLGPQRAHGGALVGGDDPGRDGVRRDGQGGAVRLGEAVAVARERAHRADVRAVGQRDRRARVRADGEPEAHVDLGVDRLGGHVRAHRRRGAGDHARAVGAVQRRGRPGAEAEAGAVVGGDDEQLLPPVVVTRDEQRGVGQPTRERREHRRDVEGHARVVGPSAARA
jgi:hypothetical protein